MKKTKFITTTDISGYLNISKTAVYNAIKSGDITAYQFGNSLRVKLEDFEKYIEENRIKRITKIN